MTFKRMKTVLLAVGFAAAGLLTYSALADDQAKPAGVLGAPAMPQTPAEWDKLAEQILPTASQDAWTGVRWYSSLVEAFRAAIKENKPLALYYDQMYQFVPC